MKIKIFAVFDDIVKYFMILIFLCHNNAVHVYSCTSYLCREESEFFRCEYADFVISRKFLWRNHKRCRWPLGYWMSANSINFIRIFVWITDAVFFLNRQLQYKEPFSLPSCAKFILTNSIIMKWWWWKFKHFIWNATKFSSKWNSEFSHWTT